MSKLQPVKGTRDILPEDWSKYLEINESFIKVGRLFGFSMVEIPVFEFTRVFSRSLGDATDIVTKEMYTFEDKGGEQITLRPEGTAGLVRAFLSNGLTRSTPVKFLYSGPMFRYERPQKGRYRQFYQLGAELIGAATAQADIETLSMAERFLTEIGLTGKYQLEINSIGDTESRNRFRESLVDYFSKYKTELSKESQERLEKNPMRILDSKQDEDQKFLLEAPELKAALNKESSEFFDTVLEGLTKLGVDFKINPRLVRGLDYYCHTVFEFTTDQLGSQNAILSGGRYDGLVQLLGGPETPGIGFAAGTDRLALLLDKETSNSNTVHVIPLNKDHQTTALEASHILRNSQIPCEMAYSGNLSKRLTKAQKQNAPFALIVSANDAGESRYELKDLETGEQSELSLDQAIGKIDQKILKL